jgi:heme A synthase
MNTQKNKYSRRTVALFWLALVALVIGVLIYLEQIALLYVIATVALVLLLLVVAFADLEKVGADGSGGFNRT